MRVAAAAESPLSSMQLGMLPNGFSFEKLPSVTTSSPAFNPLNTELQPFAEGPTVTGRKVKLPALPFTGRNTNCLPAKGIRTVITQTDYRAALAQVR